MLLWEIINANDIIYKCLFNIDYQQYHVIVSYNSISYASSWERRDKDIPLYNIEDIKYSYEVAKKLEQRLKEMWS